MSVPVLGLIGAIGGGKSATAAHLAARGGCVVDADHIGHAVLDEPSVVKQLTGRWGTFVASSGRINRRAIAAIVFTNADEKRELESIVFPLIKARCQAEITAAVVSKFIVLDAAIMLEAGWDMYEKLLYIDAPRPLRLQRVARRGWTAADLDAREASQWPAEIKMEKANAVIVNDGTPDELARKLDTLLTEWGWL